MISSRPVIKTLWDKVTFVSWGLPESNIYQGPSNTPVGLNTPRLLDQTVTFVNLSCMTAKRLIAQNWTHSMDGDQQLRSFLLSHGEGRHKPC